MELCEEERDVELPELKNEINEEMDSFLRPPGDDLRDISSGEALDYVVEEIPDSSHTGENDKIYSSSEVLPESLTKEKEYDEIAYWDRWREYGFFTSLWDTWTSVMFRTDSFFKNLPSPNFVNLFLYYLLFSLIGVNSSIIPVISVFGMKKPGVELFLFELGFILVKFFVAAAVLHFSIFIFGETRGFGKTLQIISYGSSPSIFLVIPVAGAIADFFYRIAIYISGVHHTHKLSVAAATGAVLLPLFAIFFFMIIVMVLIIALAGGSDVEKFHFFWKNFSSLALLIF